MLKLTTLAATFIFASSVANASTLSIDFNAGTGNSNENFVIQSVNDDENNIEIGIKAKERFVGDLTPVANGRYRSVVGESGAQGSGAAVWNFDYSIDLGDNTFNNYDAYWILDYDPTAGNLDNLDFVQIDAFEFFLEFGDSVNQGSQNIGFGFLTDFLEVEFDPFAAGEYQIGLSIFSEGSVENPIASVTAFVDVAPVPLPPGAWFLLSGLGAFAVARRRKTA